MRMVLYHSVVLANSILRKRSRRHEGIMSGKRGPFGDVLRRRFSDSDDGRGLLLLPSW